MMGLPVFGQVFHWFCHVFLSCARFCYLGPLRWSWGTVRAPFDFILALLGWLLTSFWCSWGALGLHFGALEAPWGLLLPKLRNVRKNIQIWGAKMTNLAPTWRPKRLQNWGQDAKKSMLKNNTFLTSIFQGFGPRFGEIFSWFLKKTWNWFWTLSWSCEP